MDDRREGTIRRLELASMGSGRVSSLSSTMQRLQDALPKKPWQQEPEMKHPAHRDFTAERIAAERESTDNFLNF